MKPMLQRLVAVLLLAALTVPICIETVQVARRKAFVQALQAGLDVNGTPEQLHLQKMLERYALSADAGFLEKVKTAFSELYRLFTDLAGGSLRLSDAECIHRGQAVFRLLFELDEAVQATRPAPQLKADDSFLAFGASLLWKFMDFYDAKRMESQTMSEGVQVLSNLPYVANAEQHQTLDIYYPPDADEAAVYPVIIDIHGGGLMYGEKEMNQVYASRLATEGYIVVVINYRLCPAVLYDDQVRDVLAAYAWTAQNAERYGFDLQNVYVVGDSAGGQLAFYTSLVNTSPELQALYGVRASGLSIRALGLISGMFDMKSGLNSVLMPCYLGYTYADSPYYKVLQPEEVLNKGVLPPSYIVTSAKDFLRPASVSLDALLTENGVEHEFHDWELTFNRSSGHITSVAYPDLEESRVTIAEMLAFFEAHRIEA